MNYKTNLLFTALLLGKYLDIKPGSLFYFSIKGDEEINMVLFEIK